MEDQVMSLADKGVKACFFNSQGSGGRTYIIMNRCVDETEDQHLDEPIGEVEQDIFAPKYVSLKDIKQCEYPLIYAHPEALLQNRKVGTMLRSKLFQQRVCAIVVDEVHMISEWGPSFRKSFKKLGELTCLFPEAAHLAVTATGTPALIKEMAKDLQYRSKFMKVTMNPDRPNIYLEVCTRLPNIKKYEKLDNLINPIIKELDSKLSSFPLTIVYINNDESLGYCYQSVSRSLGCKAYMPQECQIPENRIFAQHHTKYTESMKSCIVSELRKQNPKIRLVLTTVALGMGLNAPSIRRVIHFQPPTSLEKYFQEIGRAGRDGLPASAILYFNNSDIAKNREGMFDTMVAYCTNKTSCLRQQLVS